MYLLAPSFRQGKGENAEYVCGYDIINIVVVF